MEACGGDLLGYYQKNGSNCKARAMKVLVVGDGHSAIHEVAVEAALRKLGHQVETFYWESYFRSFNPIVRLWCRAQNKFLIGPRINQLNHDLFEKTVEFAPRLIFIYRGTHVTRHTLMRLKSALPNAQIYGYNNDDPFSSGYPPWVWRHFMRCVPIYDLVFAYRNHNLNDFIKLGAKRVQLLRSWFIPEVNHYVSLNESEKLDYECDVVFIGHYENDGRVEYLEEIVNSGYKLRIFGPPYEWNKVLLQSKTLCSLAPVHLVWNAEYSKAISGAKIGLCFFSKLNRDTYTRRCFEIPATGTMLLSEYSDEVSSIYIAGIEADFFKSKQELVEKVKYYLGDDTIRRQVALRGYQRVSKDGHDILSRISKVVQQAEFK